MASISWMGPPMYWTIVTPPDIPIEWSAGGIIS